MNSEGGFLEGSWWGGLTPAGLWQGLELDTVAGWGDGERIGNDIAFRGV